jgi:hypothetical protein|tara:strand:- start:1616 stop:1762 length:147 start_codon:yes stop_codon:yes gene_type:complete
MIENIDVNYIIITICLIGISYNIGRQLGIESTIDFLETEGIIEFDNEK